LTEENREEKVRIRQLEYFVEICRVESITQAAENLNIAQPALGMQIRSLESEFGTTLLNRTRRGTVPTAAGLIFLEEAQAILARVRSLRQRLKDEALANAAAMKLGLTPSLSTLMTGNLLETANTLIPPLDLQIFEEFSHVLIPRVESGELDMALVYSLPAGCKLSREPLMEEALNLICAPGSQFDVAAPIAFRELEKVPFAMPSPKDFLRLLVTEALKRESMTINVAYQVESMQAMKDLIARGKACGVLPYGNIVRELEAGVLHARPIVSPALVTTLYATWAPGIDLSRSSKQLLNVTRAFLMQLCAGTEQLRLITSTSKDVR
jgi:LysR family nitrogen assimilation transcriptional regulator